MNAYFLGSTLVLAGLLYYPATQLIWASSVRRLQRKHQRQLSKAEIDGQRQRARVIAVILVLPFSYLFNWSLLNHVGPS